MGGVPSVPVDKSRTVEVISAGYSRTGTVSMSLALEKLLDGPVMHGGTQIFGREDSYAKLWKSIFDAHSSGDRPRLLKLLRTATAGFVAVSDSPAATMFTREMLELYPEAKLVVVERDPDRWWKSMEALGEHTMRGPPMWFMKLLLWPCRTYRWAPYLIEGLGSFEKARIESDYFGGVWDKFWLTRYNDWVRSCAPSPDEVLTMSLSEGWEPLAKFVGRAVPDEPFPWANDAEAMHAAGRRIFMAGVKAWLGIFAAVGVCAAGGWYVWSGGNFR